MWTAICSRFSGPKAKPSSACIGCNARRLPYNAAVTRATQQPQDGLRWKEFLRRPLLDMDPLLAGRANSGKRILLTGAGGSIGSALAKSIIASGPELLILLDHSDQNLYQIHRELASRSQDAPCIAVLGDICDDSLIAEIFARHRPEIVYHAAAFKHVPLMEANPIAAVWNNAIGTHKIANAAIEHGTARLILISTDKAVNPRSVMGASKRVAEMVVLALGSERTWMGAVRLGNVLGSQGSVVPLFLEQIQRCEPVTVTHPEVRRYFLTLTETVGLILEAGAMEGTGGIFVPQLENSSKIVDLANYVIGHCGTSQDAGTFLIFTGLRPGDKLEEELVSRNETTEEIPGCVLRRVRTSTVPRDKLEASVALMMESIGQRDLAAIVDELCGIVPEYKPSESLLGLANRSFV
jgi:FlaA1/EpsC-like NDP-sugar epimerase